MKNKNPYEGLELCLMMIAIAINWIPAVIALFVLGYIQNEIDKEDENKSK